MLIVCNGMFRSGSTLQYNLVCSLVESLGKGERKGWFSSDQLSQMEDQLNEWALSERWIVIKAHSLLPNYQKFIDQKTMVICYTYRDLRDVAVSIKRHFKKDGKKLRKMLDGSTKNYFELQKQDSDIIWQKYEETIQDIPSAVKTIAKGLQLKPDPTTIDKIANEWSLNNTRKKINNFEYRLKLKKQLYELLDRLDLADYIKKAIQVFHKNFQWKSPNIDSKTLLHLNHISSQSGRVGLWKTELTQQEIEMITERYQSWLLDAGYSE